MSDSYGDLRHPAEYGAIEKALMALVGEDKHAEARALAQHFGDNMRALEDHVMGMWIPNDEQDLNGWILATTTHDLFSWTVHNVDGQPFPFATRQQPMVTLACQPGDAVAWDAQLQVRTATAGGGTLLGVSEQRNPGTNNRYTATIICNEWVVAAETAQTYTVRLVYSTAVPTTGLDASGIGEQRARTRIRRDVNAF